jgi:hypothetical protein
LAAPVAIRRAMEHAGVTHSADTVNVFTAFTMRYQEGYRRIWVGGMGFS